MQKNHQRCLLPAFLSSGLFLLPMLTYAVSSPSTINPAQLEKRFDQPLQPRSESRRVNITESVDGKMPANADAIKFQLKQLTIEGATLYSGQHLTAFYEQYLDKQVSLADIYQIAEKITAMYGNAGYMLSKALVPAQTIEAGRVRLVVVEGYIDDVVLQGSLAAGDFETLLLHYRQQITASRPLQAKVLERYLLLANDLPGLSFRSVLNPSVSNAGAATLVMTASQQKTQGNVSLDNRGSESSGPWQLLLEGAANNLLNRMDKTTLRMATVPTDTDELQYWQLSHEQTVSPEGMKLGIDISRTRSEPDGSSYRALDVETRGADESIYLQYPLRRSRAENLFVSANFNFRESDTLQLGTIATRDKLRVLRLSTIYDVADDYAGGGVSLFSLTLNQGLDIWDAQSESRGQYGDTDFTSLAYSARRIQQLPLLGKAWSADLRLQGQYANETLPSPEQFGLGGEYSVRGYEPSEWTGDSALTTSLELHYQMPVSWEGSGQLYGFYDYGKVWRENEANLPIDKTVSADAAGIGARLELPENIFLNLELAKPFDDHFNGDAADWEMYGRVSWQF